MEMSWIRVWSNAVSEYPELLHKPGAVTGMARHPARSCGLAVAQEVAKDIRLEGQVGFGQKQRLGCRYRVVLLAPNPEG